MSRVVLPMRRFALVALALLASASGRPAGTASAGREDPVDELVARFRSVSGRHDDSAYELQRATLDALADLASEPARRALRTLYQEERLRDRRRTALVLAAMVRRGGPPEVDFAIRAVEESRDPVLSGSLSRIVGAALRDDARAHARGPALERATPPVKAQIARALGAMGDRAAVLPLLFALREGDLGVRAEALAALGLLGDDAALPQMAVMLASPDARVRDAAARAMGVLSSKAAVPYLLRAIDDSAPLVVESVATSLAMLDAPQAIDPLVARWARSRDTDLRLEDAILRALERLTGKSLGDDPDLWRAWWKENRDRPATPPTRPNDPQTVGGARYYGFSVRTSRVQFVLDVSRSMGWNERLVTAQKELQKVLESLPSRTRFDLIVYSDMARAWAGKLTPATAETVRRAVRFVERLEPENGTNVYDAIRLAMKDEDVDTVFFLSDGSPTVGAVVDPEQILAEVKEMNRWRRVRFHTVALVRGEPPADLAPQENRVLAADFMRRLAQENDGQFREIR